MSSQQMKSSKLTLITSGGQSKSNVKSDVEKSTSQSNAEQLKLQKNTGTTSAVSGPTATVGITTTSTLAVDVSMKSAKSKTDKKKENGFENKDENNKQTSDNDDKNSKSTTNGSHNKNDVVNEDDTKVLRESPRHRELKESGSSVGTAGAKERESPRQREQRDREEREKELKDNSAVVNIVQLDEKSINNENKVKDGVTVGTRESARKKEGKDAVVATVTVPLPAVVATNTTITTGATPAVGPNKEQSKRETSKIDYKSKDTNRESPRQKLTKDNDKEKSSTIVDNTNKSKENLTRESPRQKEIKEAKEKEDAQPDIIIRPVTPDITTSVSQKSKITRSSSVKKNESQKMETDETTKDIPKILKYTKDSPSMSAKTTSYMKSTPTVAAASLNTNNNDSSNIQNPNIFGHLNTQISEPPNTSSTPNNLYSNYSSTTRTISGRRSVRPIGDLTFYHPIRSESYRKLPNEFNDSYSSINATAGSEIPNDSFPSASLRSAGNAGQTLKRYLKSDDYDYKDDNDDSSSSSNIIITTPKKPRLDFSGLLGFVASPVTKLRAKLQRTKIQGSSTPNDSIAATTTIITTPVEIPNPTEIIDATANTNTEESNQDDDIKIETADENSSTVSRIEYETDAMSVDENIENENDNNKHDDNIVADDDDDYVNIEKDTLLKMKHGINENVIDSQEEIVVCTQVKKNRCSIM